MVTSYQLVAWTEDGRVKMIPSQFEEFFHESQAEINNLIDGIRYNTCYEVGDILRVSRACEKLALRLLDMDRAEEAFLQFARAAECCCMGDNWEDCDEYEALCRPLRGRFFAMYSECRKMVREWPRLKYLWSRTGLQRDFEAVTEIDRWIEREYNIR